MIPELGQVALILALQLALAQALLSLLGASRNDIVWMAMGAGAAGGQLLFVLFGFAALAWAFWLNDFSVLNVAEHSSRQLPLWYRLSATWGSHEGSMLLWALILSIWTVFVSLFSRSLPRQFVARVLGVLGAISTCFLAFVLFTSNPFLRLEPPPPDGMDLNPLLQDPGMVMHPPLLYMGYVGFAVAFAFALAAMLERRFDANWARWSRRWTLIAWVFLSLGIALGSWWAYYELGWGGWWFWDPTENASLMPWLAGTALLHSLAVTHQRGVMHTWSLFLAITAFSLSLSGTFLVRSGVLSSVHAFAQDPARGFFILLLLVLVIGGSWILFALRVQRAGSSSTYAPISRETALLAGGVLLLVALASVLLGTIYPLLLDALNLGKVSVGAPYFNAVFVPLLVPALLLIGLAVHAPWGGFRMGQMLGRLKWQAVGALLLGLGLPFLLGAWRWQAALALTLALWIALNTAQGLLRRRQELSAALLGMSLAHLGLAIGVSGMGLVSAYETEQNLVMQPGSSASVAGYTLTFKGVAEVPGANYSAVRASLAISRDGHAVGVLEPEKRIYHKNRMTMTESAIRYGWTGDIYVALGEAIKDAGWSVRLFYKPFVGWIWLGAALMVAGGLLGATSRHLRGAAP